MCVDVTNVRDNSRFGLEQCSSDDSHRKGEQVEFAIYVIIIMIMII